MGLLQGLLCFAFLTLHGVDASNSGLRRDLRAFLAPSITEPLMLETASTSESAQQEAMACLFMWVGLAIVPCCCFLTGLSAAGCGFYPFINPCFSVPLFLFNLLAILDMHSNGQLDKFMTGKIVDPICFYVTAAICLQALFGFCSLLCWLFLMDKHRRTEADAKARMDKMAKAMEANLTRVAMSMAKEAQEKSKVEVIAEIKKELAQIEEVLDVEHKAYYASDEFNAKCDAIFDGADANKNGVIDPDEFQAALAAALDDDMVPLYKTELFKAFDLDNNQNIERDEFRTLVQYIDCHGPAKLKEQSVFERAYAEPKVVVKTKVFRLPM